MICRRVGVIVGFIILTVGASAQEFRHPGVFVSGAQLEFVRAQVKAKKEPMYSTFQKAMASKLGTVDYQVQGPPADGTVECGSYDKPNVGCSAQDQDSMAAYVQALEWYITGDHRYADNSINILNTWARGLKQYTNSNAPLKAAWGAEEWPRAAEILRYSHSGWKAEDMASFTRMLSEVVLPRIKDGSGANGNWELSMIDGMMGIAVFTEDRALLQHAETMWMERVPSYIYVEELDGPHPVPVPRGVRNTHWYGTTDLDKTVDGISQETCRDLAHTSMGLAAAISAAETAHIQGDKLYEAERTRLVAAMEFDAHLLLKKGPVPALVCDGTVNYTKSQTFVVGYNEYARRLGAAMPETKEWIEHYELNDPSPANMFMIVFEPLTHGADVGP